MEEGMECWVQVARAPGQPCGLVCLSVTGEEGHLEPKPQSCPVHMWGPGPLVCLILQGHFSGCPCAWPSLQASTGSDVSFISPTTLAQPRARGWAHLLNAHLRVWLGRGMARWVESGTSILSRSPCSGPEPGPIRVSPETRDTLVALEAGLMMGVVVTVIQRGKNECWHRPLT